MSKKLSEETTKLLNKKFNLDDVEKTPSGFHYVPIHKMVNNANIDFKWKHQVLDQKIIPMNDKLYVSVTSEVTIYDENNTRQIRCGIGGAEGIPNKDFNYDFLLKTALSNSIKKAFNNHGYAMYLWDEEERINIDKDKLTILRKQKGISEENKEKLRAVASTFSIKQRELELLIIEVHNKIYKDTQTITNVLGRSTLVETIEYNVDNEDETLEAVKALKKKYILSEFQNEYIENFVSKVYEIYKIEDIILDDSKDESESDNENDATKIENETTEEENKEIEDNQNTEDAEAVDQNSVLDSL